MVIEELGVNTTNLALITSQAQSRKHCAVLSWLRESTIALPLVRLQPAAKSPMRLGVGGLLLFLVLTANAEPTAPTVDIVPAYVNDANQTAVDISITGEVGAIVSGSVTDGGAGLVSLSGTIS